VRLHQHEHISDLLSSEQARNVKKSGKPKYFVAYKNAESVKEKFAETYIFVY
jgi:hypothetical protein